MAALNSNQPSNQSGRNAPTIQNPDNLNNLYQSPVQQTPGSGQLSLDVDESPYLDFDGEFDDSYNFDLDGQMIGDLPGSSNGLSASPDEEHDLHDKRKSIDGSEDGDEGGGKRREGEEKAAKKPGRKPLMNEPTSVSDSIRSSAPDDADWAKKRKAQNRAAQRAFRDRKEKHLKDLETKVEDLEKASDSATQENGLLRAQVERLQVELKEYRKRLSWVSNGGVPKASAVNSGPSNSTQSNNNAGNSNDFRFEFPKFGDLPGALFNSNGTLKTSQNKNQTPNAPNRSTSLPTPAEPKSSSKSPSAASAVSRKQSAPTTATPTATANSPQKPQQTSNTNNKNSPQQQKSMSYDSFNGLFSPSVLAASRNLEYFPPAASSQNGNPRPSTDTAPSTNNLQNGLYSQSSVSNSDSPSGSSDSQRLGSSIGTSPEPSLNSPTGNKVNDFGLNTINEEYQPFKDHSLDTNAWGTEPNTGNDFNWLVQQNGGSFDPVLFGDYREPQDAIVSQDFGSFFNEAFPLPDLGSPFHNFNEVTNPAVPPKVDLMKQVEAAQNGEENQAVSSEDRTKMMTCNKIWYVPRQMCFFPANGANLSDRDRLQSMEKFRNGEIDVDNLCSELRAKARCSEGGAVVDKNDVDKILGSAK